MSDQVQVSSPKSVESGGSNSKFKTLKKKIRNKFRLSRGEDMKTIAQAVETLKRSNELLSEANGNPDEIKNEFKELKNTLQSIISQNQILAEVMKSVDSTCPDPFNEPEKFSVYFAQKSFSLSGEFENKNDHDIDIGADADADVNVDIVSPPPVEVENALLRLQNLRMEEQRGFQIERENFETRLGQLSLLQQEIEFLRKQNYENEILLDVRVNEIEDLIKQNKLKEVQLNETIETIENMKKREYEREKEVEREVEIEDEDDKELEDEIEHEDKNSEERENSYDKELELQENLDHFKQVNEQLKDQLEETLKTLQETLAGQDEKDCKFREISEENIRLKIEFEELKKELSETRSQLADLEKEPISSITLEEEKHSTYDESAFKYVYLSNLVLKFLQFPEQRTELSNIILTTLQADQPHFQQAMNLK